MIRIQKELFLKLIHHLPIKYKSFEIKEDDYYIYDANDDTYLFKIVDKNRYLIYLEMSKMKYFNQAIFTKKVDNYYLLLFKYPYYKSEKKPVLKKVLEIIEGTFEDSKFLVLLKKEGFKKLNNIYKVLDNKFSYYELRIREIETKYIKTDSDWIILANYNILLDAKVILYDLQQDIFSLIDKQTEVYFGIIMKNYDLQGFHNNKIIPTLDLYFAPLSMAYLRVYFETDDFQIKEAIYNKIQKIDNFNKKYFVFMGIYIYILNINFDAFIGINSISSIVSVLKDLKKFMNKYYNLLK